MALEVLRVDNTAKCSIFDLVSPEIEKDVEVGQRGGCRARGRVEIGKVPVAINLCGDNEGGKFRDN